MTSLESKNTKLKTESKTAVSREKTDTETKCQAA